MFKIAKYIFLFLLAIISIHVFYFKGYVPAAAAEKFCAGGLCSGATIPPILQVVTSQSGTTYTLTALDCATTIQFTSASAITVTLPNSLPVGCHVAIEQDGAGQITFSAASGALLHSSHTYTKTFGQFAGVDLSVLDNSNGTSSIWYLFGDGA